jgi:hypothetical protein
MARSLVNVNVNVNVTTASTSDVSPASVKEEIQGLEVFLQAVVNNAFPSNVEKLHGGVQFSIFIKTAQTIKNELNEIIEKGGGELFSSGVIVSDLEARAIMALVFGSEKHGVPEKDSIFYANGCVNSILENREDFLDSQLKKKGIKIFGGEYERISNMTLNQRCREKSRHLRFS